MVEVIAVGKSQQLDDHDPYKCKQEGYILMLLERQEIDLDL